MPRTAAADILGYVPPELHKTKRGWWIDYYCRNPLTGELERKQIRVNRISDLNARKAWVRQLIAELTRKLQSGWTPWAENGQATSHTTLGEALDLYDRVKARTLRHSSPLSYASQISVLREWCRGQGLLDRFAYAFGRAEAVGFLHYLSEEREIGNRTYNNYIVAMRMLFAWMKEKGYCTDDPFADFRKRKEAQKGRAFLHPEERVEMAAYIEQHDPHLLHPVLWIYYGLVRPGELRRLRVGDVDLKRQVVILPPDVTKSGKGRQSAIPDVMVAYLLKLGLQHQPPKAWLVGPDLLPGEKPIARNTLNRHWVQMRTRLRWPASKQLYSLRDTGIIDLLRAGVDPLSVMQQAGHEDLSTTNKYVRHAFPHGPAEVRAKAIGIRDISYGLASPG